MQFPVEFRLHRSLFLRRAVLLLAAIAASSVLLTPWPWLGRALALFGILLLLGFSWRQLSRPLPGLRCTRSGELLLRQPGTEEWRQHSLQPDSLIHPWLTVLLLRESGELLPEGGRPVAFRLVLLADSLTAMDFRRLRYTLRWLCRGKTDADFPLAGGEAPGKTGSGKTGAGKAGVSAGP